MTPEERRGVDLLVHLEALWDEREKRLDERWGAQEEALKKASASIDRRLTVLNDLRSGVVARGEYDTKHDALRSQVSTIRESLERLRGEVVTREANRPLESRLSRLENWRANVMGRAVAVGILGAIFVAGMAAIFTHLAIR